MFLGLFIAWLFIIYHMKQKDNAKKYPAIEKEMEELRLKCSKQEE